MLHTLLSTLSPIFRPRLGRCPSHWDGFDSRAAAAGKNRLRGDSNKYRPHQGAAECERRRMRS